MKKFINKKNSKIKIEKLKKSKNENHKEKIQIRLRTGKEVSQQKKKFYQISLQV